MHVRYYVGSRNARGFRQMGGGGVKGLKLDR